MRRLTENGRERPRDTKINLTRKCSWKRETKSLFDRFKEDQRKNASTLKISHAMDLIKAIFSLKNNCEFPKNVFNLSFENPNEFLEFINYSIVDFKLNSQRPHPFEPGEERTLFCEAVIPLFKAFGNTTHSITYSWGEKKITNSNYLWIASKEDIEHTLGDTVKNLKSGSDALKYFVSNYRNASFQTLMKLHLYSCQVIQEKITSVQYSILDQKTWQAVECRTAVVPTDFEDIKKYTKIYVFLYLDIKYQASVYEDLEEESLG